MKIEGVSIWAVQPRKSMASNCQNLDNGFLWTLSGNGYIVITY